MAHQSGTGWTSLSPARRNSYYPNKILDVPQMQTEQDYGRFADALHQRLSLGTGILCGLGVRVVEQSIEIDAGVAVDGWGRTIVVPGRVRIDPWGDASKPPCCTGHPAYDREERQEVTLWLCFKECDADPRAISLSTCTPPDCAYDTIVETWCLDVRPGGPLERPSTAALCEALLAPTALADKDQSRDARRNRLCEALAGGCAPGEDPCVPLATMVLTPEGIIDLRICPARNRLYSNALLFEMILCLADRVDSCCNKPPKVAAATLIIGTGARIDAPATANPEILLGGNDSVDAIEIRFTTALDTASVIPQASGTDPATWSVRIETLDSGTVIPALVSLDSAGTVATVKPEDVALPPGAYRLIVTGDDQSPRKPVTGGGTALDGEPTGLPSGNDSAGGDFILIFRTEEVVSEPFRVLAAGVANANGEVAPVPNVPNPVVTLPYTTVIDRLTFALGEAVDTSSILPATGNEPPDTWSVLVETVDSSGATQPLPGTATLDSGGTTITFTFRRPSAARKPAHYRATLFGDAAPPRPAIVRATDGIALDGEPLGLPSGDGTAGGNFVFDVILVAPEETLRILSGQIVINGNRVIQIDPNAPDRIAMDATDEPTWLELLFNAPVDPASVLPAGPNDPPETSTFLWEVQDAAGGFQPFPYLAKLMPDERTVQLQPRRRFIPPGDYRLTVFGTAADRHGAVLRRADGAALDGEGTALPSGDGTAGGDYSLFIRSR